MDDVPVVSIMPFTGSPRPVRGANLVVRVMDRDEEPPSPIHQGDLGAGLDQAGPAGDGTRFR